MKKFTYLFFIAILCLSVFAAQASGFTLSNGVFCVHTDINPGSDFQAALDAVTAADNEVRLKQGTYNIADSPSGHFSIQTNHTLTISGGWNADCTAQTNGPQLTILQGGATQVSSQGGVLAVIVVDNPSPATVSISNMTFRNGSADQDGGGLYCEHDYSGATAALVVTFNLADVIAENNSNKTYGGSGIAVFDWGTDGGMNVNISDCIVRNNYVPTLSNAGPAGIYIDTWGEASEVSVSRCQVLNNRGAVDGGGVYIDTGAGNATLVNNVIAGNSVSGDNGGGIYSINTLGGNLVLTNNTITANETTGGGGGIYAEFTNQASTVNIYNNIIYGNTAAGDGDALYINNLDTSNPGNPYSIIKLYNNDLNTAQPAGFYIPSQENFLNGNNINNIDPLFSCAASDNYHLTSLSLQVLNSGNNAAPAVPSDDLDGLPRPFNSIVDMGAYEFQNITTVLPGDFNSDGVVDIQDALLGVQILTGITPAELIFIQADTNCDGIISMADILFILQKISGLEK
jgi:hypothetical protein